MWFGRVLGVVHVWKFFVDYYGVAFILNDLLENGKWLQQLAVKTNMDVENERNEMENAVLKMEIMR